MTKYEELMNKSDEACKKAIEYKENGEESMANFWKNASEGFKEKARELKVEK
ncbi:MAG: hypothetical protein J6T31_05925 [Methanobrevibacter sp.]|nr:hypothetical protein [Methanobrevibacter sp.]